MATLNLTNQLGLVELAKRKGPKGNLLAIAEVLTEDNEILQDGVWVEANDTASHKSVKRASLPSGSWRKLNDGVGKEASETIEVVDTIGMLETWSEVDVDLVKMAPNPAKFRSDESLAFVEGLGQHLADTLFYGNANVDTEEFTGLAPRLADASLPNVYDAGGSGADLTSIFLVQWGVTKTHLIYPKGSSTMGVEHTDMGIDRVSGQTSNTTFRAYVDHYQVKAGLVVRDDRRIARIANIQTSGTSNIFDEDDLITALNKMPKRGQGAMIYCNTTILTQMDIAAKDKTNVNYGLGNIWGVPTMTFRGVPVRLCDAILDSESQVT